MRVYSPHESYSYEEQEADMAEISITGPHEGEIALSGPVRMRILEDGSTTSHRLETPARLAAAILDFAGAAGINDRA
jgi:hypothetical protein